MTQVTEGMRKSLFFIVDRANGLAEEGVATLTEDDVTSFLAPRALLRYAWLLVFQLSRSRPSPFHAFPSLTEFNKLLALDDNKYF